MDTSSSPAKNKLLVTTSWDDGDILDARLAELLERYGIQGTFYITKDYRKERLAEEDIRALSRFHEIGGHSLTHPDLRAIGELEKREEILGSKQWLEGVLGKEVSMFCYPRGYYDDATLAITKESGYRGARTTKLGNIASSKNPFEMHTTMQVYPFPLRKLNKDHYYWGRLLEPYAQRAPGLRALGVSTLSMTSWQAAARAAFNAAHKKGGTFHVWGHSWEIEKYGMWEELEEFLRYISGREDCIYATNGSLLQ